VADLPLVAEWQRVTHRLLGDLDRRLAPMGLTAGEINALACLGEGEPRALRDLVEATGQRPSTLTGVVDRLERRGLVARQPQPADRRAFQVAPTAAGRRAIARVAAAFDDLGAALPDDTAALLAAVAAALERDRNPVKPPRRGAETGAA
jgi:MarR family transcriptional regulator, organic hydroperoxide resistance regulator